MPITSPTTQGKFGSFQLLYILNLFRNEKITNNLQKINFERYPADVSVIAAAVGNTVEESPKYPPFEVSLFLLFIFDNNWTLPDRTRYMPAPVPSFSLKISVPEGKQISSNRDARSPHYISVRFPFAKYGNEFNFEVSLLRTEPLKFDTR